MDMPCVLSIEDNDGDFTIIEFVLKQCLGAVNIRRASDGEEAIFLLKHLGKSIDHPAPDLVLLDFNLPKFNGLEVLESIKSQDFGRDIPVVIFTSSKNGHEERKALALGATEFITKPIGLDNMLEVLKRVCSKYLDRVGIDLNISNAQAGKPL